METAADRLERHLAEMARNVGAAPYVKVYLPPNLEGIEAYGYDPGGGDEQESRIQKDGKTFLISFCGTDEVCYIGGDGKQWPGRVTRYHLAGETMEEVAEEAYSAARHAGQSTGDAMLASSLVYELDPTQAEVYSTLLKDGTPTRRAYRLAQVTAQE